MMDVRQDHETDGFLGALKPSNTMENFIVSSTPSATISLLQALVGPICVGLLKFERCVTQKQVEKRTLFRVWAWYIMFVVVFYFLFTFNSSVQSKFHDEDGDEAPSDIFSFLVVDVVEKMDFIRREALASQLVFSCLFFMTYLSYQFLALGVSIVHPGNILWWLALTAWHNVRNKVWRGLKGGRMRPDTKIMFNYLWPIWMHPGVFYGKMIFVMTLCLMYSIICPLVLPVGFLIGAFGWFTHRYNVIMNWQQPFSFGGSMIPQVYSALKTGIYIFQWIMFALLFLAKPEVMVFVSMLPVFLITRNFDKFIKQNKFGEFLSLEELQGLAPPNHASLQAAQARFTQPCFREPENASTGLPHSMHTEHEAYEKALELLEEEDNEIILAHQRAVAASLSANSDVPSDDDLEIGQTQRERYGLLSSSSGSRSGRSRRSPRDGNGNNRNYSHSTL